MNSTDTLAALQDGMDTIVTTRRDAQGRFLSKADVDAIRELNDSLSRIWIKAYNRTYSVLHADNYVMALFVRSNAHTGVFPPLFRS